MKWVSDASETRYVWPHRVLDNVVRMAAHLRLMSSDTEVDSWPSLNWQSSQSGITSAMARWQPEKAGEADRVRIDAVLSVPSVEAVRAVVLPEGSTAQLWLALVVRCARTRKEWSVHAPLGVECHVPTLFLEMADLFGEIVIQPYVALGRDAPDSGVEFASRKGSIVGTGYPISLWVDDPAERPGRGLRCFWDTFPDEISDALYRLSIDEVGGECVPKLYMNSNHAELRAIVDYNGRKKPRATTRDALFALIASSVWMDLAEFAAKVAQEGSDPEDPRTSLAEKILKTLKANVRKDVKDIVSAFENDEERGDLSARVQTWMRTASRQVELVASFEMGEGQE